VAEGVKENRRMMFRMPKRSMTLWVMKNCVNTAIEVVAAVNSPKKRVRLSSESKVWV